MNRLKEIFDAMGITPLSASKQGLPYHALFKQYKGERNVGPKCAILYEQVLGIPRSKLRPDIWPDTDISANQQTGEWQCQKRFTTRHLSKRYNGRRRKWAYRLFPSKWICAHLAFITS